VNYLPNRVALLSENSPPPRNPQLAYCVDQYVSNQIAVNGDAIIGGVDAARQIDLSILPKKLAQSTSKSFDNVSLAITQLRDAEALSEQLAIASDAFRPMHKSVRAIERSIRQMDKEIKHLSDEIKGGESDVAALEHEIAEIEAEKESAVNSIPEDWPEKLAAFRAMQKQEKTAFQKYTRSAQAAYQPVAATNVVLEGNAAFMALEADLMATKADVDANAPENMVDPLSALGKRFGEVSGTDAIKSGISKARRALKSRNPDKDKAHANLDKAIAAFHSQIEWRAQAQASILPELSVYENTMRDTIGIRDQAKLTKTQALFVAKCQSDHRDVSLNF
jgi:septal ring factor EnvC (AmiA/AmiB activator)